jgi:hypothetical protein
VTTTALPATVLPTGATVPTPRPPAERPVARRRERPPSQYWDVFEACWRSAPPR